LLSSRRSQAAANFPGGLAIDASTGTISAPDRVSQPTTYHFQIEVVDIDFNRASRIVSITFAPGPLIQTTSLPNATVGSSYCASLSAAEGTPGCTWSLASGTLPPGIALDSYGHLTGTPTTAGTYTFSPEVTDAVGRTLSTPFVITIS
jgi:large repetitive protein